VKVEVREFEFEGELSWQVWLVQGHQSFCLRVEPETAEHAEWHARMVRLALARAVQERLDERQSWEGREADEIAVEEPEKSGGKISQGESTLSLRPLPPVGGLVTGGNGPGGP
jgi:hypothetical protein